MRRWSEENVVHNFCFAVNAVPKLFTPGERNAKPSLTFALLKVIQHSPVASGALKGVLLFPGLILDGPTISNQKQYHQASCFFFLFSYPFSPLKTHQLKVTSVGDLGLTCRQCVTIGKASSSCSKAPCLFTQQTFAVQRYSCVG